MNDPQVAANVLYDGNPHGHTADAQITPVSAARGEFMHLLTQAVAQADRTGERLALHYLRLGRCDIRDSQTRAVADLGSRLQPLVRRSDGFADLGDRTFAFLQRALGDLDGVTTLARKILDAAAGAIDSSGLPDSLAPNVGIALHRKGVSIEEFMTDAERALRAAEAVGAHTFRYEEQTADSTLRSGLLLQHDLQSALSRNEFYLEFQPQVDSSSGQVRCIEALIRWQHPKHGVVQPSEFIPTAESTGLITDIGAWTAAEACRRCQEWNQGPQPGIPVAINVSAKELDDPDLPLRLLKACRGAGLAPGMLELELTERALISSGPVSAKVIEDIRSAGIALSVDDFGTGYCSLQYLKDFPAQKIKIPMEFVTNVATNPVDRAIVEASVRLAHGLGMKAVAEGVETPDQADSLRDLGCDALQGFLFGRPARQVSAQATDAKPDSTRRFSARIGRINDPEGLEDFTEDGYGFRKDLSDAGRIVFTRA